MDEAAPTEGAVAKKKRLLRRVPTPVILTLLGIALTAWLLPALTRQWDDRQKAQELKTALLTDMARASASVIVGSRHPIIRGPSGSNQARIEKTLDDWELAGVEIDEKLSAYFPSTVASEWHAYRLLVEGTFGAWMLQERIAANPRRAAFADREVSGAFDQGLRDSRAFLPSGRHKVLEGVELGETEGGSPYDDHRLIRTIWYVDVENILLQAEHTIATHLLAANPQGYSTTWGDFFRDLIP
jgi:hypothetical protein